MWGRKPNPVHVLTEDKCRQLAPVSKLVRMVMLLAIKDGATVVRIDPNRDNNLAYFVGDAFVDLVPALRHILKDVCADLQSMARIHVPPRALSSLLSWLGVRQPSSAAGHPLKGRFRLQIDGKQIQVLVCITSVESGSRAVLRLVNPAMAPLEAGELLIKLWRRPREHQRND
jgi:type IV pilus assembly protein PilB